MKFLKDFGIYTISSFLSKAISFAFLPVFTKYIAPDGYGVISIYFLAILFVSPFVNFSLLNTLSSDYFKLNKKEYSEQVTSLLIFPAAAVLVIVLTTLLFRNYLMEYFKLSYVYILILPFIALSNLFFELVLAIIRNQGKAVLYSVISVIKVVLELSLSFIFIVFIRYGYEGRLIATILVGSLGFLLALGYLNKHSFISSKINYSLLLPELKYSFPVIINQMSIIILIGSDKFFMNRLVSKSLLGSYSVASQIAYIVFTFSGAFVSAFYPYLYKKLADDMEDKKRFLRKKIFQSILFVGAICAIVQIGVPILYKVFINHRYLESSYYIKYIIIGYFFWSVHWILFGFVNFYKLKKLMLVSSMVNILLVVGLNIVLDPLYGVYGVLAALIITCFIAMAYVFLSLRYKYDMI